MYSRWHLPRWTNKTLRNFTTAKRIKLLWAEGHRDGTRMRPSQISCLHEVSISREKVILWVREAVNTFSEVKGPLAQRCIWVEKLYPSKGGMGTSQVAADPHPVPPPSHLLGTCCTDQLVVYIHIPIRVEFYSRWLRGGRCGFAPKSWLALTGRGT